MKRVSNTYYNIGLEKAHVRDLSGAIVILKKSLQFDKKNIDKPSAPEIDLPIVKKLREEQKRKRKL